MNLLLPWLGVGVLHLLLKLSPQSFQTLFLVNIWLVSMPHTFSTFFRSDRRSAGKLATALLVLAGFALLIHTFVSFAGVVLLYSFYFLWQQFHYARQNYGIGAGRGAFDQSFFLGTAVLSVLCLFSDGDQNFFGYLLASPVVLPKEVLVAGSAGLTAAYVLARPMNRLHALAHVAIFTFAYVATPHFAQGWLYLNVYHNLQYLKFMRRHEASWRFLAVPFLCSAALYGAQSMLPLHLSLVLVMALNFSHYAFDGFIWKRG